MIANYSMEGVVIRIPFPWIRSLLYDKILIPSKTVTDLQGIHRAQTIESL